jgi:hypothetical protein
MRADLPSIAPELLLQPLAEDLFSTARAPVGAVLHSRGDVRATKPLTLGAARIGGFIESLTVDDINLRAAPFPLTSARIGDVALP